MQDARPASRWKTWCIRLLWVAALLIGLEGLVRLVTWVHFRHQTADFPELRARYREAQELRSALTIGVLIDRAAIYPAFISERIVPFAEIAETDFVHPPAHEEPTPGVVRIAFLGSSSTRDGYPEQVEALLEAELGEGRVEVLNLGIPNSHSATTALLAERFLPRYRPHLVVVYLGFDDLVFYRARAQAIALAARREAQFEDPGIELAKASRGLLELIRGADAHEPLPWLDGTWITEPIATYWELERMVAGLGGELWVSSFAAPDPASLSDDDRRYYETELALLWPLLGDSTSYAVDVDAYRRALADFADRSGAPLIDVAAAVHGGRETFLDNAHLTPEGRAVQARVVADALLPRVRSLLAAGAPVPSEKRLPEPRPLQHAPAPALEPGRCVQGPCPEGTCYVAGGTVRYGNDESDLASILARQRAGIGVAEEFWFEDETPELELAVSPFCVDRTEASTEAHHRCQTAGVCPQTLGSDAVPTPTEPAIFPTLDDARAFCRFRGGRLPTDVEFDAAARGGDERLMPWGDTWTGAEANYCGAECRFGDPSDASDGVDGPAPIGSFSGVSPTGAIDMAGNLWEWIDECFDSSTHRRFPAGTLDPIVGPQAECRRFLRGGSFRSYAGVLERRTSSGMPDTDIPTRGARCVFDFGTRHQVVAHD
jgi:formylglycine-generating enzyme required for sulfatase activity/lysophospholipase L1-like esterase